VEERLTELVAAARAAWPAVHLDAEEFVTHLAARVSDKDPAAALKRVRASDLYLACACARGDAAAIGEFEKTFMPGVSDFIARQNPARAFADEVRQILRQRLFVGEEDSPPKIASYTGSGPLGGWLRVAAVRTAQNLLARRKDASLDDERPLRSPDPDPELLHIKRSYGREFKEAFQKTLASLPPKERNVLALYYLEGMSSAAIGKLYGVHGLTIRRWIADCRKTILDETMVLLKKRLKLRSAELNSLLALVQSQLDESISRFLK
jgi:RNA polymerase sigma-70 factor (ECF subfamily)